MAIHHEDTASIAVVELLTRAEAAARWGRVSAGCAFTLVARVAPARPIDSLGAAVLFFAGPGVGSVVAAALGAGIQVAFIHAAVFAAVLTFSACGSSRASIEDAAGFARCGGETAVVALDQSAF